MQDLYYAKGDTSASFNFNDEALRKALKRIYQKDFNTINEIEENLFNEFFAAFNSALDKGFGRLSINDRDYDFYKALQHNNAVFSAFKTHRMQNDIAAKMIDENGVLKPFNQFLNDVKPITDHQCKRWLKTEYDTAVIRAHQAADWKQFEREADILPNLEWMKSTSINPGQDHVIYWDLVLPINHPFWNEHRPGDRWNCKCSLRSTDKPISKKIPSISSLFDNPADGLDMNPGTTGKLFADSHPYVKNAYKDAAKAVNEFIKQKLEYVSNSGFNLEKSYKNGGELLIHSNVEKSKSDYKAMLTICNQFAKEGKKVAMTPSVHFKSGDYAKIYESLEGTKYNRKCPDFMIDGKFYEFEGFVKPWSKRKVGNMIKHGLKQSSRIVIDNNKGCSDRYIKRLVFIQAKQTLVDEVWVYEKGHVRLIYKKVQGDH